MNLWAGIAMVVFAALLIWVGRPNKEGVHPKFLRFSAATVLYPPIILVFIAMGIAAISTSL
jgi:hypothetical protein